MSTSGTELSNAIMEIPHDQEFSSRNELLKFVREFGYSQGYAVSISSCKPSCTLLICSKGGKYRNKLNLTDETRKRNAGSNKTECPFKLAARFNGTKWTIDVLEGGHSHGPELEDKTCGRQRLTQDQISKVANLTVTGVGARAILSTLKREDADVKANTKAINNLKAKLRRTILAGRTPIEALLDNLVENKYLFSHQTSADKAITHLFFAHPHSVKLSNMFPTVFLLDCTYKTNVFKMPLLNIVGVTAGYKTFISAFVFLQSETAADYIWALERFKDIFIKNRQPSILVTDRELALMTAINTVFPSASNMICVWHIEKNVLLHSRNRFKDVADFDRFMKEWTEVIRAPDEETFDYRWSDLQKTLVDHKDLITYLGETWIALKEHFVSFWVDRFPHFGHSATSRVEGAHAILKRMITNAIGNLFTVFLKLHVFLEEQYAGIAEDVCKDRRIKKHFYASSVFSAVRGNVSEFALKKTLDTLRHLAKNPTTPSLDCNCRVQRVYRFPCIHLLQHIVNRGESLTLGHYDDQWRIDNKSFVVYRPKETSADPFEEAIERLRERQKTLNSFEKLVQVSRIESITNAVVELPCDPHVVVPRGRPSLKVAKSSTKRDPSAFEYMSGKKKLRNLQKKVDCYFVCC